MILLLLACSGGFETSTSPGTTPPGTGGSTASTPGSTAATTPPTSPDAPAITGCEATCTQHTTGEDFYQWTLACEATDPQGPEDIANGRFIVYAGDPDAPLAEDLVACAPGSGTCTAAFHEEQFGTPIVCLDAASYTFRTWISDWEGHESAPYETTGLYVP